MTNPWPNETRIALTDWAKRIVDAMRAERSESESAHPQRVGHHADETSSLTVRFVTSTFTARPSKIGVRFRTSE
jgi:hypothetical protein